MIRALDASVPKQYQEVNSDLYAKSTCFSSNFVYELLSQSYGLPAVKLIEVGNQVNGFNVGWTVGACCTGCPKSSFLQFDVL